VNREELNWLLETIQDAKMRSVSCWLSNERGISSQAMADVARERGWINHTANQFLGMATRHSTEYATTELPICHCQIGAVACPRKVWRVTTGKERLVSQPTYVAREEYALVAACKKRGDSAAFEILL